MKNYSIVTKNLTRVYKTYQKPEGLLNSIKGLFNRKYIEKVALDSATINIEEGKIIGLVGANGTLLKILSGLVTPSSGEAKILGYTPWERESAYLSQMSILLGQKNQLWWDITPIDSYALLTKIYNLDEEKAKIKVQELAKMLQCEHVLNTQLRRLSLGENGNYWSLITRSKDFIFR
jgi:ABC-2 type transport system ATP-binding protein